MAFKSILLGYLLQSIINDREAKRVINRIGVSVKQSDGTIRELMSPLWKPKTNVKCPYCQTWIIPGYQSVVKHYMECPKNPNLVKIHETNSPLIEEIKKNIKF